MPIDTRTNSSVTGTVTRGTLRIATAGSVDDGKSTLIGRLLHDTKTVFEDQLHAVTKASRRYGDGETNLALLTDGLRAEREQGITIDVAHRYFATPARNFIVADTPGHAQYTRNMVTGASTADVAIVLIDARHGVVDQTRRHALIASLVGVRAIVVAVNKMDLIGWDEGEFLRITNEVGEFVGALPRPLPVTAIPMSALLGDSVVDESRHTPWYDGPTLLAHLEQFDPPARAPRAARLHVQRVIRPHGGPHADFRGYAGVVDAGPLTVGDTITVLPGGRTTQVAGLHRWGEPATVALLGHAVVVELADDVDIARGDVLFAGDPESAPRVTETVSADVCWMVEHPLAAGSRWWFKHGTRVGQAVVTRIEHRFDLATAGHTDTTQLALNDIGRIELQLGEPIVAERYVDDAASGRMILIDPVSNTTAGAAMIVSLTTGHPGGG
jgi:sulfate adenylyltransferase subunit 1